MKLQRIRTILGIAGLAIFLSGMSVQVSAQSLTETNWKVTFQTSRFGPVESVLSFEKRDSALYAHSLSGSSALIKKFPRAKNPKITIGDHLLAFRVTQSGEAYQGEMMSPSTTGTVSLQVTNTGLVGKIEGGVLSGKFSAVPTDSSEKPLRDYRAVIESFGKVVEQKVYDPKALKDPAWVQLMTDLNAVATIARDDLDLFLGFYFAYDNKPFSHLTLSRARGPAKELIASLDQHRVGGTPASIKFVEDIAILRVETMIGIDTEEQIIAAFKKISETSSKALIVDVRGNGGGAFAIKPLIEHIIDQPIDAGYFLTHNWNLDHHRMPTQSELQAVTPWKGFSLKSWWENIQTENVIRIRFEPQQPNFNGPVYLLIDSKSASATELAADVLSTSGVVTLVGEQTGGKMLSQSPFDVSGGFQTFVPVADYYSLANGRIEGVGVKPHVEAKSAEALDAALSLAREVLTKKK